MRRNKGFTISEVMVSIVILGVIGVCILNLFSYKVRIDRKTSRNIKISNIVTSVFNSFSSNPNTFTTDSLFRGDFTQSGDKWVKYYYINEENQKDYLEITYQDLNSYYVLIIKVYTDGELYELNGVSEYTRRIYHGE